MNPPPMPPHPQVVQDAEHLKQLSVAHYVVGGLTALGSCLPVFHLAMGVMMISGAFPDMPMDHGARLIGVAIVIFSAAVMLLGWALAVAMLMTGRWLSARRNHPFCFVVSCLECVVVPAGTVLGVFTLLVLQRPSVKALFDSATGFGGGENR